MCHCEECNDEAISIYEIATLSRHGGIARNDIWSSFQQSKVELFVTFS